MEYVVHEIKTNRKNTIPKKIHYCWFGRNPLPELAKKCIISWKNYCSDYEIIEWNEMNYHTDNIYANEALILKKWAFYSDYARLDIIYRHGGIYLDTDVELIKNLDDILKNDCFFGVETTGYIATGLGFGAVKGDENIKSLLDEYENIHFLFEDGVFDKLPCPTRNTVPFLKYGFDSSAETIQLLNGAAVYPPEYFCPLDYETNQLTITSNTISIHHFNSSWMPLAEIRYHKIEQTLTRKFGSSIAKKIVGIISLRYRIIRELKEKGLLGTFTFIIENKLNRK